MTVILSQKVGSEGRTRTCSAKCHYARKPTCACICGGKYHGITRDGKEGPKNVEQAEKMSVEADIEAAERAGRNARETLDKLEQIENR